jgi:hypothetical protein
MNPSLAGQLDAAERGAITIEEARAFIEAWPAYQPGEPRQKAAALEKLAEIEVGRLRSRLRQRNSK